MARPERRQAPRRAIDFFVQEILNDRTYLHPAINLSTDGIYILADDDRRAIDGDQHLLLEFTLPTGEFIRTHGTVTRVDDRRGQRGLGVAFTEMSPASREAIARFLNGGLDQATAV